MKAASLVEPSDPQPDGSFDAGRGTVGKNGVDPPMQGREFVGARSKAVNQRLIQ